MTNTTFRALALVAGAALMFGAAAADHTAQTIARHVQTVSDNGCSLYTSIPNPCVPDSNN